MVTSEAIFDTRVDTKKLFVSVKTKFIPRSYKNREGLSLLYLHITGDQKRNRIPLDIYLPPEDFCTTLQRLKSTDQHSKDLNLIIDNLQSKITSIKTTYRLANKKLDVDSLTEEFINGIPRVNFFAFADWFLEKQKGQLAKGTYKKQKLTLQKMKRFREKIYFTEIDHKLILNLRQWMAKQGNQKTTIEGNISTFKKFLNAAKKQGILLPIEIDDIKVGNTTGNRTDLKASEVNRLFEYYKSSFIAPYNQLVLGYFLFSCFTGLRVSEVMSIERTQFDEGFFEYFEMKKNRMQRRNINASTRTLLQHCENLFVEKKDPIYMNRQIKLIANTCGISKKISFHVGRHTFATNFLRAGGDVVSLQNLLGHSSIKQTMIYVHIVESEVNEKVFIIDKLFN
ncbi:MAG TPA: site-specific integrase [Aequorivita sp.]|nr:site-specific integrase [Aequorivita sp.]